MLYLETAPEDIILCGVWQAVEGMAVFTSGIRADVGSSPIDRGILGTSYPQKGPTGHATRCPARPPKMVNGLRDWTISSRIILYTGVQEEQ